MKKFLVIVSVLIVWGFFFWTLYEQIPEVRNAFNKVYPQDFSLEGIFQSAKENIQQKTPSLSDSKTISLQQINNVGYSFYIGQIDYPNAPALNDDIKNKITDVIYKAKFPKSLLKNVAIIIVNTLAVSPDQYINTLAGKIAMQSFTPDFMTGGGIYSQNSAQMSLIFINKTMLGSIDDILTHELGHHISSQLISEEWKKYYQLRKIPDDASWSGQWMLSPGEDFAEVYKNTFTGLRIKTYYGLLTISHFFLETCQNNSNNSLSSSTNPTNSYEEMLNSLSSNRKAIESQINFFESGGKEDIKVISNTKLQNCRKDVLLHPEKYLNDWRGGVPYYSIVDQATKDFITQIISRL